MSIDPTSGEPVNTGPKTIDNLGPEVSIDYAKRQEDNSAGFLQDTAFVSTQSSMSVTDPSYVDQLATLFGTQAGSKWALVEAPQDRGSLSLFTSGCIPSLGSYEQREVVMDNIKSLVEEAEGKLEAGKSSLPFEEQTSLRKTITDGKSLLGAYEMINDLDRTKDAITASLNQYHKA